MAPITVNVNITSAGPVPLNSPIATTCSGDASAVLSNQQGGISGVWSGSPFLTGNIFNIADCVLSLYRPQLNKDSDEDFDNSIDVLKSREVGKYGTVSFNFDENAKRFIEQSGIQSTYHYDWMSSEEEKQLENLKNEKILEEIPF